MITQSSSPSERVWNFPTNNRALVIKIISAIATELASYHRTSMGSINSAGRRRRSKWKLLDGVDCGWRYFKQGFVNQLVIARSRRLT